MYTICIQNLYHISTNFCLNFVYKIKRTMPANFYRQNVYKSLSKCGIHFVYKSLSKCGINLVYIFLCINSDLQKVCIINIMYTISIQNSYRMYTEWTPFQHILTRLLCSSQLIIARLETCWLMTGGTYQIDGLMDYILH